MPSAQPRQRERMILLIQHFEYRRQGEQLHDQSVNSTDRAVVALTKLDQQEIGVVEFIFRLLTAIGRSFLL